jgi:general L-amino acid transport system permease protein
VVTLAAVALLYLVLFGSDPGGQLVGLVTLAWPDLLGSGLLKFVFDGADWGVVHANRRLYFLGFFPDNETWRIWVTIYLLSSLAGISVGLWTRIDWKVAIVFLLLMIPVSLFIGTGAVLLWSGGAVALFAATYLAAHFAPARESYLDLAKNVAVAAWIAALAFAWILLNGVESRLWGGLLLTLVLTVVGIVASFPLGVMLALGRASTFPVIKGFCTAYIELIRAVPLITILFMALVFLPLILEPNRKVVGVPITGIELDLVLRAMVAITLFSAAYIAENVRGGLQSVPHGQVEAAEALGLSTWRILAFIVLPQAIRAVLPSLVGQFISLFKDTSLVFIMTLTDLLEVANIVTNQPGFFGRQAESLLFVALIYWIIAFSMSQASQRLERTLSVGER